MDLEGLRQVLTEGVKHYRLFKDAEDAVSRLIQANGVIAEAAEAVDKALARKAEAERQAVEAEESCKIARASLMADYQKDKKRYEEELAAEVRIGQEKLRSLQAAISSAEERLAVIRAEQEALEQSRKAAITAHETDLGALQEKIKAAKASIQKLLSQ